MSSPDVTPPRVVLLAAVESATSSEQVLATATALAASVQGAELHLVHVIDAMPMRDDGGVPSAAKALDDARALLETLGENAGSTFRGRIVGHLAAGTAWREIVQLAANLHADFVVVGTADKKGVQRLLLGSVAEQVAKKAPCAVLVARTRSKHEDVPEIEPPCPDCLTKQRETRGATLWCDRHATKHPHANLHYETPPTFGLGSMLIRT